MRDFRDAKAMAHSLRHALNARAVETTHSESLELIAKAFGYDNWNILSAKIEAAKDRPGSAQGTTRQDVLHCSFCGKSQHDVRKLIAGPAVYICDECVELCTDIVDEQLLRLIDGDAQSAAAMSTDRLLHYVEHASKGEQGNRLALQRIQQVLARRQNPTSADASILASPDFTHLRNRTSDELLTMQKLVEDRLRRFQQALHTATLELSKRRQ
jgi:hypothetical protein